MAEVKPLRTLRYDPSAVGSLESVIAPPYDVIDAELRARPAGSEPLQRGGDRPARGARRGRPLRARGRDLRVLAPAGDPDARVRARPLGPPTGLHGARRQPPAPARLLRARACRGLRGRPHPPARADPPRAQGGSAGADARHPGQPLPHLQPLPRPRGRHRLGPRRGGRHRALRPGGRPRGHPQHALARGGRRAPGGAGVGAGRRGAADRRRPPPLRDRAGLRRGGRRRGRASLRADAAVLAVGPGADRVPDPPPAHRAGRRPRQAGGHPRDADARLRGRRRSPATSSSRPASPTGACSWVTWTASTSSRSC